MILRTAWSIMFATALTQTVTAQVSTRSSDPSVELQQALAEFDQGQQWLVDRPDRAHQLFQTAARRLERILATGIVNGQLEYDLGNCYLQAGDVGRAILHYRRAQRVMPGDARLADNLKLARSRCLTGIEPTRRSTVMRNLFFWHYQTSRLGRTKTLVGFYFFFWVLLTVRTLIHRRALSVAALLSAVLIAVVGVSIGISAWTDRHRPEGVVTAMDVAVYKGPGSAYQRQFEQPLQPGVEFTLRERRGGWWAVELPDGNAGWINAGGAELIPPVDVGKES